MPDFLIYLLTVFVALPAIIVFLVKLSSCRWEINYNRENYASRIAVVSFEQFVRYYNLNPAAYDISSMDWCPHRRTSGIFDQRIHFHNTVEHFRYHAWRGKELRRIEKERLEDGQTAGTEEYLRSVMKDVEAVRKRAAEEYDEAMSKFKSSQSAIKEQYQKAADLQRKLMMETGLSYDNLGDLTKKMIEAGLGGNK